MSLEGARSIIFVNTRIHNIKHIDGSGRGNSDGTGPPKAIRSRTPEEFRAYKTPLRNIGEPSRQNSAGAQENAARIKVTQNAANLTNSFFFISLVSICISLTPVNTFNFFQSSVLVIVSQLSLSPPFIIKT